MRDLSPTIERLRTASVADRRSFYEALARRSIEPVAGRRPPLEGDPLVSVILRTVDRRDLLREALASLANQTFTDFETVLVNDGGEPIDDLLEEAGGGITVRLIALETPQGRTRALNTGLNAARGRLITYMDDDDVLYPFHLATLAQAFNDEDRSVVYSLANKALMDDTTHPATVLARQPFHLDPFRIDDLLVDNFLPLRSLMHRRECIDVVGPFDETFDLLEDWEFVLRLLHHFPVKRVDRFTWEYRFRVASSEAGNVILAAPMERLDATRRIYDMYPATTAAVRMRRGAHIRHLDFLNRKIRAIAHSPQPKAQRDRTIAELVAGFAPTTAPTDGRRTHRSQVMRLLARSGITRRIAQRLAHRADWVRRLSRQTQLAVLELQALEIERSVAPD